MALNKFSLMKMVIIIRNSDESGNIGQNLAFLILDLPKVSIADDTSSLVKPICNKPNVFSITPNND
jgi:hypothetical protein